MKHPETSGNQIRITCVSYTLSYTPWDCHRTAAPEADPDRSCLGRRSQDDPTTPDDAVLGSPGRSAARPRRTPRRLARAEGGRGLVGSIEGRRRRFCKGQVINSGCLCFHRPNATAFTNPQKVVYMEPLLNPPALVTR